MRNAIELVNNDDKIYGYVGNIDIYSKHFIKIFIIIITKIKNFLEFGYVRIL